jgi:hypothetical protein
VHPPNPCDVPCVFTVHSFFRNLNYVSFVIIKVQKQVRTSRKFRYTHFPCHDCQGYSKSVDIQSFGPFSSFFYSMSVPILIIRLCESVRSGIITLDNTYYEMQCSHAPQFSVRRTDHSSKLLVTTAPAPQPEPSQTVLGRRSARPISRPPVPWRGIETGYL